MHYTAPHRMKVIKKLPATLPHTTCMIMKIFFMIIIALRYMTSGKTARATGEGIPTRGLLVNLLAEHVLLIYAPRWGKPESRIVLDEGAGSSQTSASAHPSFALIPFLHFTGLHHRPQWCWWCVSLESPTCWHQPRG